MMPVVTLMYIISNKDTASSGIYYLLKISSFDLSSTLKRFSNFSWLLSAGGEAGQDGGVPVWGSPASEDAWDCWHARLCLDIQVEQILEWGRFQLRVEFKKLPSGMNFILGTTSVWPPCAKYQE